MKEITITAIADTHGFLPKDLPASDLLIIAGDFTAMDTEQQHHEFFAWVNALDYEHKVLVPGNHDVYIDKHRVKMCKHVEQQGYENLHLLIDKEVELFGLKIYGSPWTKTFYGMNPQCKGFAVNNEAELLEYWHNIPYNTDILVTHCPPYAKLDCTSRGKSVGSLSLAKAITMRSIPLNIFGHIHEDRGELVRDGAYYYNVSYVDENYMPHKGPVTSISVKIK